jgi:hypothetical protein
MEKEMTRIIDLTKSPASAEHDLVQAVLDSSSESSEHGLVLLCRFGQHHQVSTALPTAQVLEIPDGASEQAVLNEINELLQRALSEGKAVDVFSFSGSVKRLANIWAQLFPDKVSFGQLGDFLSSPADVARVLRPGWSSSFMPEEEAARAVAEAMWRMSSGPLPKTNLRPLLESLDPRFAKSSGGYAAMPRFITSIVDLAVQRGFVSCAGQEPAVVLELTDAGIEVARNSSVTRADQHAQPATPNHDQPRKRSDVFVDHWRLARLGPFMEVRLQAYQEIDSLVQAGPTDIRSLVHNAVKAVRERDTVHGTKYPWSRVIGLVEKLMRKRPVALTGDDPTPIVPTWSTWSTTVTEMLDDWQLLLDGELILHLIDRGLELRLDDLPDLAGALYNSRGEDATQRVGDVVLKLVDDQLIEAGDPEQPLARRPDDVEAVRDPGTVEPRQSAEPNVAILAPRGGSGREPENYEGQVSESAR